MAKLSPYAHELNPRGTGCVVDCPACEWVDAQEETWETYACSACGQHTSACDANNLQCPLCGGNLR